MSAWALREDYARRCDATAASLRSEGFGASLGVVLGSGLSEVASALEERIERDFVDIEGFTAPAVVGHRGRLVQATLPATSTPVLVLQGRLHAYEGLALEDVVFPVATLLALGVRTLVLTNAAGGLLPDDRPGDLMALTGLLDLHGVDPLAGLVLPAQQETDGTSHDAEARLRAGTHAELFDPTLSQRLLTMAAAEGVAMTRGTYASLWGPAYETPAEIGVLRRLGAAAVGMSTGPEAALAHRLGARLAGISTITNVAREAAAGVVTHDEVVEVGTALQGALSRVLVAFLRDVATAS